MSTPRLAHRIAAALVVLLSLSPALAQAQSPAKAGGAQAKKADAEDTDAPKDHPPGETASGQKLLNEATAIAKQVGAIRGLSLKHQIAKGLRNRKQLRKALIKRLGEEVTDEDVANEAKVFKKLGLMPADLNYKQTLLDVLTEQIAGFYDQNTKKLYIMEGIPLELQRPAMAHEIFHAIQDQHFDIQRMVEPISSKENGDFALARSALIEGDASVVMIDFSLYENGVLPRGQVKSVVDIPMMANVLKQLSRKDMGALQKMVPKGAAQNSPIDPSQLSESALADAPRMVRKMLVFPYFGGMRFVIAARAGHTWKKVNKVYRHAPVSTEQILHPDRYFAGDEPVELDFQTDPVLDHQKLIYDSVFGEYQMRLVLEQHLLHGDSDAKGRAEVDRAMTGWGGDRMRAFEDDAGHVLLTHLSEWDTIKDAHEYFDALVHMQKVRFPDARLSHNRGKYGQSVCMLVGKGDKAERIYLEQWGDLVLHLEGLPTKLDANGHETDPTAYMLRQRIMHSIERTPFEQVYKKKLEAYDAKRAQEAADKKADETPAKAPAHHTQPSASKAHGK